MISIIIPVHRKDNLVIENLLKLARLKENIELIYVFDYVDFDYVEFIKPTKDIIELNNTNISVVICANSRRKGVSGARNTGLELSNGLYISFLDYDDYYSEDRFSTILDVLPDFDMVMCEFASMDLETNVLIPWKFTLVKTQYTPLEYFEEYNFGLPHLASITFNRKALNVNFLYFEESLICSEDTLFKFMAIDVLSFIIVKNSPTTIIIRHNNNTTINLHSQKLISSRLLFYFKITAMQKKYYSFFRWTTKGYLYNLKKLKTSKCNKLRLHILIYLYILKKFDIKYILAFILNKRFI